MIWFDELTNLTWELKEKKEVLYNKLNWEEGLEYAVQRNIEKFEGFDDWRVPNVNELRTLLNRKTPVNSDITTVFWSCEDTSPNTAYFVYLGDEKKKTVIRRHKKTMKHSIYLVRGELNDL